MTLKNFFPIALFCIPILGNTKTAFSQDLNVDTVCVSASDYTILINTLVDFGRCDTLYKLEQRKTEEMRQQIEALEAAAEGQGTALELCQEQQSQFDEQLKAKNREIKMQKARRIAGIITSGIVFFVAGRASK